MTPDMRSVMAGARLPRTVIALAASLLLGFAVGSAIAGLSISRSAAKVGDADFVLMVADLYQHEKSVYNARERLLQIGRNPLELADAAADASASARPDARRDNDALKQLAAALRQSEGELAPRAEVPVGTIAVGLLILLSIVLGAGAAWLWKRAETGGMRLPYLGRSSEPDQPSESEGGPPRRFGKLATRLATQVGRARAPSSAARPERRRGAAPASEPSDESPARPERRRPVEVGAATTATAAARLVFESYYSLGEDPYDSIHPIHDPRGELLGACGLSATEPSDRPGRYYGFTAWLQDYGAGNDLAAVGLVTRAGQIARSAAVNEWLRRGTIDGVLPVERGADHRLSTPNVTVRITIVDVDYAPPSPGSPGYFGRLTVRFELL
jgi:hypothetical protein